MELFKLRYNLYKYLIKNDFNYKQTFKPLNIFKNLSYITILFFIFIFIIGYEYLNFFIIFFIIILLIYIYNVENVLNKLNEISTNKSFQIYSNYYKTLNKIFNINYDNINDIDSLINSSSSPSITISRIEMIYGGIGYTPFQEYTLTFDEGTTAKVRALKDGSLSGEIYNLISGTGYTNLEEITLSNVLSTPEPIASAIFKAYKTNSINIGGIKEYSIFFKNVYENIRRNAGYIDNILKEDIEDHLNIIKKEEDLLKYIDVYDDKYDLLKKFLIISRNKNEELFTKLKTEKLIEINKNTYLIDLKEFEKNKDDNYSILMNYLDIKDLKSLEIANLNHKEDILKTLMNFDKAFYYLILMIIIILTIIFHIFFIKL